MKIIVQLLGLGLLLFGQPQILLAQSSDLDCQDIIRLQNGNTFRGQIEEINGEGQIIVFKTWNGIKFDLHREQIRKITQRCKEKKSVRMDQKAYDFQEKGWYHHTRAGLLVGQSYSGQNRQGVQLQHSSGKMFSRQFGLGLGAGVEAFSPEGNDVVSYPVFMEIKGFLRPKRISPFYSLSGGWAFPGRKTGDERWGYEDHWRGGWMAEAALGYRIGNHFTLQAGVRLQHKEREWQSNWGWGADRQGVDQILHKRLILAVGLLL